MRMLTFCFCDVLFFWNNLVLVSEWLDFVTVNPTHILGSFISIWSFKTIYKESSIHNAFFMALMCLGNLERKKWSNFQAGWWLIEPNIWKKLSFKHSNGWQRKTLLLLSIIILVCLTLLCAWLQLLNLLFTFSPDFFLWHCSRLTFANFSCHALCSEVIGSVII